MSALKKQRGASVFSELGMGQGKLSFSKIAQTRLSTFDWRSENEH
jgi:hypothetical protein